MDGNDPTAELKAKVLSLTLCYPLGTPMPEYPLGRRAGLSSDCRRNVITKMDQALLWSRIDIAQCKCRPNPRSQVGPRQPRPTGLAMSENRNRPNSPPHNCVSTSIRNNPQPQQYYEPQIH